MAAAPETQRISKLTPLPDAFAAIDALTRPVDPIELELVAALGRVLAADVIAPTDRPAEALALRDGWAVKADETVDAGSYAPALLSSVPQRVDAGQPLPSGADAVAPVETVTVRGSQAEALAVVAPGEGVLPGGGDVETGKPLCSAAQTLRAIDQAVLSAAGIERVTIREPRIRLSRARVADPVIAAGYEWLAKTLTNEGAAVIPDPIGEIASDNLEAAFHHEASDAILVLGGTGSGMSDVSVHALAKSGHVAFHGVGLMPGETAAFGTVGARSVLLVPGRIDSALAVWLTLGRHWLKRLAGGGGEERPFTAELSRKVTSTVGMMEVVPVLYSGTRAEPLSRSYLSWSALARANGWLLVPPESEGYPAGAQVAVRPLR
jgi:molybdopterin biosynthesis enzyme